MDISDLTLIGLSSILVIGSASVICCVNYRRVCPVKKEDVVIVQAPDWK